MGFERFAWRWRSVLLLALLLPVAGWVLWESQRVFRADWASAAARHQVTRWLGESGGPSSAQWEGARVALQASLDITPDDPDLHQRMGDLYWVAGQRAFADATLRRRHFGHAARRYETATQLRPSGPHAWAMLAAAYQAAGEDRQRVHAAWARSIALGPLEGHVQPVLMHVVLWDWDGAAPSMRAWAEGLFDAGNPSTQRAINAMARRYGLVFAPSAPE